MKASRFNTVKIIAILVTLVFVLESVVTLYTQLIDYDKIRILSFYKIGLQVLMLILIKYNNLNKKLLYLLFGFIFVFSVSTILNPLLKHNFSWLFTQGSIYFLDRYIFIFLFALLVYSIRDRLEIVKKSFEYIEVFLLLNAAIILLSFLFGLGFFKSYYEASRFGYDGLFNKPNEATIVYIIYIIYLYHNTFVNKTQKLIKFIFIVFTTLLIGTKSALLFLSILFVFHFLFVFKRNNYLRLIILSLVIILLLFFKTITRHILNMSEFWGSINQDNLLTILLSHRDILVLNNIEYISSNWTIVNYFFGGSYYTNEFVISQMDGVDLFLFVGVLGMIIYFILLKEIFFERNFIINGLIIIVFVCGFLGGALLTSTMAMILLFLVSFMLNKKQSIS